MGVCQIGWLDFLHVMASSSAGLEFVVMALPVPYGHQPTHFGHTRTGQNSATSVIFLNWEGDLPAATPSVQKPIPNTSDSGSSWDRLVTVLGTPSARKKSLTVDSVTFIKAKAWASDFGLPDFFDRRPQRFASKK